MIVKLLTEYHLEFLSLKGGCRGSSESTHVKMSNCWKSHAAAQIMFLFFKNTVKYSNSGKYFTIFVNFNKISLSKQLHLCSNPTVWNYWRDANNYQQEK